MTNFTLKLALLTLFLFMLGRTNCTAQIGIGTTSPQGAFDITSTTDGLLVPRVALSATNVATVVTPTVSELVYNTFTSAAGPNQVVPGFYYWDGSLWIPISTGSVSNWSLTGNSGTVATTNFVGTTDAVDLVTRTNNTEKMRVTSAGNLGIGTTTPTNLLEIGNAGSGSNSAIAIKTATSVSSFTAATYADYNGGVIQSTYPGGITGQNLNVVATGANSGNWPSNIAFHTRNSGGTNASEKARLTSSGNLGIGTTTPVAKLDVAAGVSTVNSVVNATGSINDFLQFNVQNTSTGTQAQSGYSATADNGTATTGFAWLGINNSAFNFPTAYNIGVANDVSYIGSGQDMYIANAHNTKSIIFSTGRVTTPFFNERMRLTNAGNLGINTTTPANKLEITHGTAGNSGLRFTNLTNASVLSTNATGDVIPATGATSITNGLFWGLTGNSGTVATTNFVGTTDAVDLVTRTNNTEKMRVTSAGNVGIGTTTPVAKLDIAAGVTAVNSIVNATGSINDFLQFNVQNTSTGTQAQSGYSATANNGTATTGFAWMGINNSAFNFPTAYNIGLANDVSYIGSGQDLYIANANNTKSIIFSTGKAASPFFDERMKIYNSGKVSINNLAPAASDYLTVNSSAVSSWAINGYSANNGAAVYGSITSGTTTYGAVQGEYIGSVSGGTGVRGITDSTGAGTTLADSNSGVNGQLGNANNIFSFGIKGECNLNTGNQVGGVIGISNGGTGYGMLGYKRSTGTIYAVLGNIAYQNSTFRNAQNEETSSSIGIGINGGFLGGHIKGNQYGLITKGARFGSYTDGAAITNKGYAVINENENGEKIATYASTSTTIDISTKGTGELINGTATVLFDKNFSSLVSKGKPTIVTVSPMGETNGVYVASVTEKGFTIKENKGGTSTISFYWIAVGEKNIKQAEVPTEVLAKDFDTNLESILAIDEESKVKPNTMWWNGKSLEFGKTPPVIPNQNKAQTKVNSRN